MKYYGIDSKGLLKIQEVESLPIWTSDYERRIIYNKQDQILYYGNSTGWSRIIDHTHTNKTLLDTLTQENIEKIHEHENMDLLDSITLIQLNKIHNHDNKDILDQFELIDGELNFNGDLIGGGGGVLSIDDKYIFTSLEARNNYFGSHLQELVDRLYCIANTQLYQYRDSVSDWVEVSLAIKGEKGDIGFSIMAINSFGPLADKENYDSKSSGWTFLDVTANQFYIRYSTIDGTWAGPYDFPSLDCVSMDEWDRFPGYTLETSFESSIIRETLKVTETGAIFAIRTTQQLSENNLVITVECPALSLKRQNTIVDNESTMTQTIVNFVD